MSSCFQALGRPHVTPPASLDALAAFQHARRSAGSSGTARVYSLILFGFELRMLELHMRVLAPQVEKFLVAESTLTFQFGEKPAHLSEALRRGSIAPELAQKLRVDVVSPDELRAHCGGRLRHGDGLAVRCVETHQRARLFRLLFAVAADGDIALLSDVDEIAKPAALALLRRCPPFGANGTAPYKIVLESVDYKFGVHCLSKSRWTGLHAYSVGFLRAERSKIEDANGAAQWRLQVFSAPRLVDAGWHFSSFGTPQELKTKLSTWGHANLFDEALYPGSLSLERLERCARGCFVACRSRNCYTGNRVAVPMPFVRPKPGDPAPSCVAGAPHNRRFAIPASDDKLFDADVPAYLSAHLAEFPEFFPSGFVERTAARTGAGR